MTKTPSISKSSEVLAFGKDVEVTFKLTQYSHGAGCGCKIAPKILDEILSSNIAIPDNNKLIVGNDSKDDAAVYDLGNGTALISTTDFFMPIVDDPFEFGVLLLQMLSVMCMLWAVNLFWLSPF